MLRSFLAPARSNEIELLDRPSSLREDLPANLADIRRLNQWFGGTSLAVRAVEDALCGRRAATLLDVATGSADIPVALYRWSRSRGIDLSIAASDVSAEVLREAQAVAAGTPIELVQADALDLPWDDASVDIVTCCLALHHFAPAAAAIVLRQMWRVARVAIVVVDLTRGYLAYAGTWLATHSVARNRLTRHDGPLSVLRAYTPAEMRALADDAGIPAVEVRPRPLFRQTMIARKRYGIR